MTDTRSQVILDEDLVKVYNIANLFNGLEEHPLTDEQIKKINQILLQIDKARTTNNISLAQRMIAQVKNKEISFTLSDKEKEGLIPEQIEQKQQVQIDQIYGMVEIMELARTTKNPEVLKAIMEQKCFKFDLIILFAILSNKNIHQDILSRCIYALIDIGQNSKNLGTKKLCVNRIIKISNDKNINQYRLFDCIGALGCIAENSKDLEIREQCINGIKKISKNPKAVSLKNYCEKVLNELRAIILSNHICTLKKIYENFENSEIQERCVKGIKEISENPKADLLTLYGCVDALEYFYKNSKYPEIQKQCFEKIIEILKNPKVVLQLRDCCEEVLNKLSVYVSSKQSQNKTDYAEIHKPKHSEFLCISSTAINDQPNDDATNVQPNNQSDSHVNELVRKWSKETIKVKEMTLKYLYSTYGKSKYSKIQKQCFDGITKISENSKDVNLKNSCKEVPNELDVNVSSKQLQNEKQTSNYIEISKPPFISSNTINGQPDDVQPYGYSNQPKIMSEEIKKTIHKSTSIDTTNVQPEIQFNYLSDYLSKKMQNGTKIQSNDQSHNHVNNPLEIWQNSTKKGGMEL